MQTKEGGNGGWHVIWYAAPHQISFWGKPVDTQVEVGFLKLFFQHTFMMYCLIALPTSFCAHLPARFLFGRLQWSDLFFDLIFVAATFKLGIVLTYDIIPNYHDASIFTKLFYFCTLTMQFFVAWTQKTQFTARFGTYSFFHVVLSAMQSFAIATAVVYIPSEEDASGHSMGEQWRADPVYAKGVSVALFVYHLLLGVVYFEVYRKPASATHTLGAKFVGGMQSCFSVMFMAAYATSFALTSFEPAREAEKDQSSYSAYSAYGADSPAYSTNVRRLAGSSYSAYSYGAGGDDGFGHVAVISGFIKYVNAVWASTFVIFISSTYYYVAVYLGRVAKRDGVAGIQSKGTPLSIGFMGHRLGEWTMLLLGESFLSLTTIVDVKHTEEVGLFFAAMITIFILFYSFFTTYPHDATKHALRRSRAAGIKYNLLNTFILPMTLVMSAIGAKSLIYLHGKFIYYGRDIKKFTQSYSAGPAIHMYCYSVAAYFLVVTMITTLHTMGFTAYFRDISKSFHRNATDDELKVIRNFARKVVCLALLVALPAINPDAFQTLNSVLVIALANAAGEALENPGSLSKAHESHEHGSAHSNAMQSNISKTERLHAARLAKAAARDKKTSNALHAQSEKKGDDDVQVELGEVFKGKN